MILYVEHDMNQLNLFQLLKEVKVTNPSIASNNTNINTNFTGLFNESISKIKKSIRNNAPKTNTKGNISMNDVDDFESFIPIM